jgi:hypothetical protein
MTAKPTFDPRGSSWAVSNTLSMTATPDIGSPVGPP